MLERLSSSTAEDSGIMAIEIEQRYKVYSVEVTEKRLREKNIQQTGEQHIIDEWFVPETVRNQADHDRWFDEKRGIAYRIRRVEQLDGGFAVVLDSKQLTEANDHNTFYEDTVLEGNRETALQWLDEKGYYNWLTIDKIRRLFSKPDPQLEVIIDTIDGLKSSLGFDSVIEIEYKGNENRKNALERISSLAMLIGCQPEDQFEKSLTVAAMSVLARFNDHLI